MNTPSPECARWSRMLWCAQEQMRSVGAFKAAFYGSVCGCFLGLSHVVNSAKKLHVGLWLAVDC